MNNNIPKEILELCANVTAKRPKTVIEHIIKHGSITTEELKDTYGYDHPPRAVRDVREHGIPLETFKVRSNTTGRMIAAYRFDDPKNIKAGRIGGRSAFSKDFKQKLISKYGERCTVNGQAFNSRYLQIDHRIPYEISGETQGEDLSAFMLLDASSQRAKSWSCENCENFQTLLNINICQKCFWAFPEQYEHVAMQAEKRLELVWQDKETLDYDNLSEAAKKVGLDLPSFVKALIKKVLLQSKS